MNLTSKEVNGSAIVLNVDMVDGKNQWGVFRLPFDKTYSVQLYKGSSQDAAFRIYKSEIQEVA